MVPEKLTLKQHRNICNFLWDSPMIDKGRIAILQQKPQFYLFKGRNSGLNLKQDYCHSLQAKTRSCALLSKSLFMW